MPRYRMDGVGRETRRARRRYFTADSVEDAVQMASAEGTIVDVATVVVQPPYHDWRLDPATQLQKDYAKELGIRFGAGITKGKIADKIDRAVDRMAERGQI